MKISILAQYCRRSATVAAYVILFATAQLVSGQASAKDLYVATNGSDSVSYSANSQSSPWRTLDYSLANIQGGDTLYIRGGTYAPTVRVDASVSGTQSNPTRITSFPGELAVIDLGGLGMEWLTLDGVDYWEISNLEFQNVRVIAQIAVTYSSTGHVFRNNRVVRNRGGDNVGFVMLYPNAKYTVIDGNEITGPGRKADGFNANTSCVYMDRVSNVQVINNQLSNCVIGIHYKHAANNHSSNNVEYAYNVIFDTDESLRYNGDNGYIHDNIIGPGSGWATIGMDNGSPGGNNNIFEHNTFAGGGLRLDAAGPLNTVQDNVVVNNLFVARGAATTLDITRYGNGNYPHNTSLDYNMHPQTSNAIMELNVSYTLAQWISHYGGSANSIADAPVFVGGANPVTPDDYRLTSTSPGVGLASDGTDVGARIDLFGGSGMSLVRPSAPTSLVAN